MSGFTWNEFPIVFQLCHLNSEVYGGCRETRHTQWGWNDSNWRQMENIQSCNLSNQKRIWRYGVCVCYINQSVLCLWKLICVGIYHLWWYTVFVCLPVFYRFCKEVMLQLICGFLKLFLSMCKPTGTWWMGEVKHTWHKVLQILETLTSMLKSGPSIPTRIYSRVYGLWHIYWDSQEPTRTGRML